MLEDSSEGDRRAAMPLKLRCPNCGRDVPFEEEDRGAEVYCPSCGRACSVPADVEDAATTATAAPGGTVAPSPQPRAVTSGRPTRVRWVYPRADAAGSGRRLPLRNCPAVDAEGRLLAGLRGEVVALTGGGDVAWSYPIDGHVPGSPALGPDGVVRVHSGDGLLHGIDRDGRAAWPPVAVGEPL
ncbi:MAG TPA: PQQ-binding-like beta-propeller repeat protein, partial [Isosphaeraceae bacterium]